MRSFLLFLILVSHPTYCMGLRTKTIKMYGGRLSVSTVEAIPDGIILGDVFSFHGFADSWRAHIPTFETFTKNHIRVLSFDWPGHGETRGPESSINRFPMSRLSEVAAEVERHYTVPNRRFGVHGWSTGGLENVLMLQEEAFSNFSRPVDLTILQAPAIYPKLLVGEWGFVTKRSLTDNPAAFPGPVKPRSPLFSPFFALSLLWNSIRARDVSQFPTDIPVLVLLGGEKEDHYIRTGKVHEWAQRLQLRCGDHILISEEPGAFHALDNNLNGEATRIKMAEFAREQFIKRTSAARF